MALTPKAARQAMIAFQRFGLGAKPGGPARIGADAKGAVIGELQTPNIALIRDPALPTLAEATKNTIVQKQGGDTEGKAECVRIRKQELAARIDKHMRAEIGFVERLVLFWSNHFAMAFTKRDIVHATIGQVERDIIRPNILGNFEDMLLGIEQHPSMIAYLDNQLSIGENSEEALSGYPIGTGLNENLAREIMELHTMGARSPFNPGAGSPYTQNDVTNFAKIMTGLSYVSAYDADHNANGGSDATRGQFIYRPGWHEPGTHTVMGKRYQPYRRDGAKQARNAMLNFARHPATAERIAFKLVRHFITDEPTPAMVAPLAKAFSDSRGDLLKVTLALLNLPEAWSAGLTKIRLPYELSIAQFRAFGVRYRTESEYGTFIGTLNALAHAVWDSQSPNGYPDESTYWLTPEGMATRLDAALSAARIFGFRITDVLAWAESLYDTALSRDTAQRIVGSRPPHYYVAILLLSPEFQRR